jgi:hypothetical protein
MKTEKNHFASEVPENVKDKLLAIAHEVENEVFSMVDTHGCLRIEPIHGVGYSGFIPFQNGGFEVTDYVNTGLSSGTFLTESERDFYETLQSDCEKDFRMDNKIEDDIELTEEQIEAFEDYEQSYFDDQLSMLRFETWIEQDNETVFLRLSIGYKDAPYYRSNHDETIKEMSFNINDLMKMSVLDLVKPFADSI